MKHNWEYKQWIEVLTIFNGKNQKAVENPDGPYPIYGSGGIMSYADDYICPENCTIIGRKGNINNPIFVPTKFWNVDTAFGLYPCEALVPRFLFLFCKSYDFEKHNKATTIPSLVKNDLLKISMPVPPMEVQNKIVAELDKINEVIEDCRELLRTLDSLAQSLFYDFFGDPISNPKGFKLKKLGKINEISSAKRVLVQDVVDNGIPFIRGTELACLSKQNSFDPSVFTMFITPEHYERVKSITGVPKPHDLLIPSINADGYIWEINTPEPLYFKDGRVLWIHVNHEVNSSKWLKFALSKIIKEKYANLSRGAVFAELTLVFLRNLDIIVPPRSLQEKFAKRIEQIEAQKKAIEETITNLQTLLDSRMDYWFN